MPRLRVTRPNAIIRSQTEFLVDLFSNIERERRTSSSSEEYYPDYTERSLSSSSDTSASNTESEEEELHQELSTGYHTVNNRIRTRSSRASTHPNGVNFRESGSVTSESDEEELEDSDHTMMNDEHHEEDIQIIEDVSFPTHQDTGTLPPTRSGSESSAVNPPKRRRTTNSGIREEENLVTRLDAYPSTSNDADCDIDDDNCVICYENYTNAGEHRLASVKCGHFFGHSCITRWIRTEGRNAVCPTCKAKVTMKDVRKHYTIAVKVTDTTEVEQLRNANAALHIRVSGLEVELARKDREIYELSNKLQGDNASNNGANPNKLFVQPRGGRIYMNPERKDSLMIGSANADARAIDFNGEFWAIGVACSQARNIFSPFGIRMVTLTQHDFKLHECYPLHSARPRVVAFSPFESSLLLSGGEDKRAIISINGTIRCQWKMPNEKPVWTGCWTAPDKVALGLCDGRVFEYDLNSGSTEPVRDYTQGVGHLPIIFTGFDTSSSALLVASFKTLIAFRNEKVFPLLSNVTDEFDKMRSISFHEASLHFVITLSPGGRHPAISHRLYRLEVDGENDEVHCIEMAQWLTDCQMSSTMWSNCLFSLNNGLYSVVYNEDKQRFDAHDWSGRRPDAMVNFPSRSTVTAIRAVATNCDSRKTIVVLSDKAIFSLSFGLSDFTS